MFDRFDVCEAYFLFFTHYHGGQGSREYARLCRMRHYFWPRYSLCYDTLTDNGRAIYDALAAQHERNGQ